MISAEDGATLHYVFIDETTRGTLIGVDALSHKPWLASCMQFVSGNFRIYTMSRLLYMSDIMSFKDKKVMKISNARSYSTLCREYR